MMRSNLTSAAEVVNWNRRILGLLGSWPEESRNVRFSVFLSYLIIHVTLEYAYLYQNIKHLDDVVASMTENITFMVPSHVEPERKNGTESSNFGYVLHGNGHPEISDLLFWYRRTLSIIGIWPKDRNNLRFYVQFVYMGIHVCMEWADLIYHIDNFNEVLENLSESMTFTIVLAKLFVFRKNRVLSELIDAVTEDCESHKYKNLREKEIYAKYNSMAKTFGKILLPLVSMAAIVYYLRPLAGYLFAGNDNSTALYVLPYRTLLSYQMTEVYRYAIAYLYQGIAPHIVTLGWVGTDGLLITLTLHVCGELSILANGIVNLEKDTDCYPMIRNIVKRHIRLIWMARNIDTAFTFILMGQLLGSALLIPLAGYQAIVNSETTQRTSLISFILYEGSVMMFLYAYCYIGECLIQENTRVLDAYYQCVWYEMPTSQSKDIIICMARCKKPIYLTAGKFYISSLENFTRVIQTSFAYLSVLRTLA